MSEQRVRPADGLIPGGSTILQYVSPEGVVLQLSGGVDAGAQGYVLGSGPEGLGSVNLSAVWESSAQGLGERYVGGTYGHGSVDLPIRVEGRDVVELRQRRKGIRSLIRRDAPGWLCAYDGAGVGWSVLRVRRGSIKPAYTRDPAGTNSAVFDVLFLADNPLSRAADSVTREWVNGSGRSTVAGSLFLYPGVELESWPAFIFRGPGTLTLDYAGNHTELPEVYADEEVQIDTRYGAQILRARRIGSTEPGRNLWPLMRGKHFVNPIPAGEVTRVAFTVSGASETTRLWGMCAQWQEGLV